ncbi:LysM peptidoglycan-binding domain-containing protein [Sporosarcina sp. SAFN-015]|uniref:LysM peptidoglycan-binding domain-containing protein n=1 Tax=Sporosarcina sp. SAFN-015 TaxID=3387274 RepID=UPI003F812417
MAIEFWLSFNSGAEKLRLPVNPPSLSVKSPFGNTDINITQFGEYTVIGERGAAELSFNSFFPREYNASYCEYADFPLPAECVRILERWRDERKPLRFVVTGTDVNFAVTIRDFSYEVQRAGSPGDIYYTLSLKEYRFLDVQPTVVDVSATLNAPVAKKPAAKKRPPVVNKAKSKTPVTKTKVKQGDTLPKIAGKDWPKVYEANKKAIGNNPNILRHGTEITRTTI